jgi:hypothetical protein
LARGSLNPVMACHLSRFLIVSLVLTAVYAAQASAQEPHLPDSQLRAFLDEHCVACHGPELQKWTFLNQRLAQHNGIAGVSGGELRKVNLPTGSHRGGLLTHTSIPKVTSDGTRTSPVLRGKWVIDRILGQPPSPPPPDTPALEPDIRGATTIPQQLDKHRKTPACASCHRHIDPPGFAMASFDVIGGWHDFYRATQPGRRKLVDLANYPGRQVFRGPDVELSGTTPEGKPFKDIDDYKRLLLADKDQLARCLARKLLTYATGADIRFADREVVEDLVAKCRARNYGFRSLVEEVVQSRAFLNK